MLGTKFNVRAREEENRVVTTLLQGLVRVDSPRTEENGYLLKPGQTLNVNTDTYQAELIEYNQPTDVLLWMKGKLEFKQHSLLEITKLYPCFDITSSTSSISAAKTEFVISGTTSPIIIFCRCEKFCQMHPVNIPILLLHP